VLVVHEPVDERYRHDLIAQDRAPLLERLVRGEAGISSTASITLKPEETKHAA
jgi:hypothetical protein